MDSKLLPLPSIAPEQKMSRDYLLFESNPVISSDIIDTLNSIGECHVNLVTDSDQLIGALSQIAKPYAAILELSAQELIESEIAAILKHSSVKIVLTRGENDGDKAEKQGWHLLLRPFTEQMLLNALHGASPECSDVELRYGS